MSIGPNDSLCKIKVNVPAKVAADTIVVDTSSAFGNILNLLVRV